MLHFKRTTKNSSSKDANVFAPSCVSAHKNSEFDFFAGIAFAVSVFLSIIIRIDIVYIIMALSALIIKASALERRKHLVG